MLNYEAEAEQLDCPLMALQGLFSIQSGEIPAIGTCFVNAVHHAAPCGVKKAWIDLQDAVIAALPESRSSEEMSPSRLSELQNGLGTPTPEEEKKIREWMEE